MQILLFTCGYANVGLILLLGSKSTKAIQTIETAVTTKIKTNKENPISIKNTFMHLILQLILKKSVVTTILNL